MTDFERLQQLSSRAGILPDYWDMVGNLNHPPAESKQRILKAMGYPADSDEEIADSLRWVEEMPWRRLARPVAVIREGEPVKVEVAVADGSPEEALFWQLRTEGGATEEGEIPAAAMEEKARREINEYGLVRREAVIPVAPPLGYHTLELFFPHGLATHQSVTLIIVPHQCYRPEGYDDGRRDWGFPVQVYALRRDDDWGIGDFSSLDQMVSVAAEAGADSVGINPLSVLFPDDPDNASPYGSSHRLFWNFLYIDPEKAPDFEECDEARHLLADPDFQEKIRTAREAEEVDYPAVTELKLEMFRILSEHFRREHVGRNTERGQAFEAYCESKGHQLQNLAVFQALSLYVNDGNPAGDWRRWPEGFRHPDMPEVAEFACQNESMVFMFKYVQWEAERQLSAVASRCREKKLPIGLYLDMAVGCSDRASEVWMDPDLFADGISLGAPPDACNPTGQEWSLPPYLPQELEDRAFQPFIDLIRANMRYAGALRIDHVPGFERLFWVPRHAGPAAGAYVSYPVYDLLGIVALESVRHQCFVVGEYIGVLPEGFIERVQAAGLLSFHVMYFEQRDGETRHARPDELPRAAQVAFMSHDMATLPGYWLKRDLDLFSHYDLFPSEDLKNEQYARREHERRILFEALKPYWPFEPPESPPQDSVPDGLEEAACRYLARTPCAFALVNLENALGQLDQVNLPGTFLEYPNWRKKLAVAIENLLDHERVARIVADMNEQRSV